ncbi:alpha/beta hydrolase [Aestuariispira insulae]|nr:alpha/beta hydrolase [Aestuariispira insulae]
MYHPDQDRPVPARYRLFEAQSLAIPGHDTLPLFSWYQKPSASENRIILYFHGNAGTIAGRSNKAQEFVSKGFGVLLPSYRYNAGNGGEPSETSLIADGLSAYQWLLEQGYAPDQIILYGESLGSGIAVAIAAQREAAAVILEAPYSSVADVAQGTYWFLPARWLVHDPFPSTDRIGRITAPILIVHGAKDRTIPLKYAERLYQAAPEGAQFQILPDAGHADLYDHGMADAVFAFLSGSNP